MAAVAESPAVIAKKLAMLSIAAKTPLPCTEPRSCPICCEEITAKRPAVSCASCHQEACRACVQTYVLQSLNDPSCMHCKHVWDREFLDAHLTKSFMLGAYKSHRERVLVDREIAMLPATQAHLRGYREFKDLVRRLKEKAYTSRQEHRELDNRRVALEVLLRVGGREVPTETKETVQNNFVRACPVDGCRGFLSTDWKCGTCSVAVCAKCHEVKCEGHKCDPAAVATAELLAKDTKPCPKCASLIHKISGCDQMFCTQCAVAFSWRTGEIDRGHIHNPHFFEWRRRTGGEVAPRVAPPRFACEDRNARHDAVTAACNNGQLEKMYGLMGHVRAFATNNLGDVHEPVNLMLRLQYLDGEITRDQLKTKVQRREKLYLKKRAVRDVYDMFATTVYEILVAAGFGTKDVATAKVELRALVVYADECLDAIAKRFNMKTKTIKSIVKTEYPYAHAFI